MKLVLKPVEGTPQAPVLDWSTTPLFREYDGYYAKILDDVFTADECAALVALALSDQEWTPAFINYGMGPHDKTIDTSYRNSDRILRFDEDAAQQLYQRLLPYVPELVEIRPGDTWEGVVAPPGKVRGVWRLVGVNERLSFMRYGPGQFFRDHIDSRLDLPDGRMSRVTIQIYLGDDGLEGGATRIREEFGKNYLDVEAKKGRVLIFQQRGICHSGEDVVKGYKYAVRSDFMFIQNME